LRAFVVTSSSQSFHLSQTYSPGCIRQVKPSD